MNIKDIVLHKKIYDKFKGLPLSGKLGIGFTAAVMTGSVISAIYSKLYNGVHIDSMHSGKDSSMSHYVNQNMTDFGSGWKGLSSNILKLVSKSNSGMSDAMKVAMTPFTSKGTDLIRTMHKVGNTTSRHNFVSMKQRIANPVLELHKNRNIGHIVM